MAKKKKTSKSPSIKQKQKQKPSFATPTTEAAMTSINSRNLYQLSLMCFSFSLILFAATYHMIDNNGGVTALMGAITTATATTPTTVPTTPFDASDKECATEGLPSNKQGTTAQKEDKEEEDDLHGELLIGYKILHHTLKKESQLKYLHWLRDATFRGPTGTLKTLLETIYQTCKTRTTELEALFQNHEPVIVLNDTPQMAMMDSIQDDVEKTSTEELVPLPLKKRPPSTIPLYPSQPQTKQQSSNQPSSSKHLEWEIRFVLIQAQATRMVVALSTSLLKVEPNQERKRWLTKLADEFEGIRESFVDDFLYKIQN